MTYRGKSTKCPSCGKAVGAAERQTPVPGDISICIGCAVASTYDENLDLKLLSAKQIKEMQTTHPQDYAILRRAQAIIMKMKADRN